MKHNYKKLIQFLTLNYEKERLPFNTARTRKTAVRRVFDSIDNPKSIDITTVNIDEIIAQYKIDREAQNEEIKQDTINTYRSRIYNSIKDYKEYLKVGDMAFFDNNIKEKYVEQTSKLVALPIPIRDNVIINITDLPIDLTDDEAKKIANVLTAFAQSYS